MKNESINFLESITWLDNDVLIPINRIRHIVSRMIDEDSYEIEITGFGKNAWKECFNNKDKWEKRYKQIKQIICAK